MNELDAKHRAFIAMVHSILPGLVKGHPSSSAATPEKVPATAVQVQISCFALIAKTKRGLGHSIHAWTCIVCAGIALCIVALVDAAI